MCTNFDFLKKEKMFESFCEACISAEKSLIINPCQTAIASRRALELAVKWMYANEKDLVIPYTDTLSALIHEITFKNIIDMKLFDGIKYIVTLGNFAVHSNKAISRKEAIWSLKYLFDYTKWISYSYSDFYEEADFDEDILFAADTAIMTKKEKDDLLERLSEKDILIEKMREENKNILDEMKARRERSYNEYKFKPGKNISEADTRKHFIDLDLKIAGWDFDKDVSLEFELEGMANKSEVGFADYVLWGKNGLPLAVVEAKRASKDAREGQQQARLYANLLEEKFGQRPIIYYTNGRDITMWEDYEGGYPPRKVNGFYTQDELELIMQRKNSKMHLTNIYVDENITNRVYQKEAITAVCEAFNDKHRKALLVMATGSGKTRTAISLVKVLQDKKWVKKVLFLADRNVLVNQAQSNFNKLLPNLSTCNLVNEPEKAEQAEMIFSTYQTMIGAIDNTKNKNGNRLFTNGHFDLIIIDEAHRSIYKKYQEIFDYFDGLLVGLTATPRSDVHKNTYTFFELEDGNPTYVYELNQAIQEGYLVDYKLVSCSTKILDRGVTISDLSSEEKESNESLLDEEFDDEVYTEFNMDDPNSTKTKRDISAAEVNKILFNKDTNKIVLEHLMNNGLKIEGGDKIGKTIIFARNHLHAEFIYDVFNEMYPNMPQGFVSIIDNQINYNQTLIDSFSLRNKMPQIAISVDMLDTGVDVPDILNLVFFKPIKSKIKFWQMIGRGTRLSEKVFGNEDKKEFYIFDWCGNFEYFEQNPEGVEAQNVSTLSERIWNQKVNLIQELQHIRYQADQRMIDFREMLVNEIVYAIKSIDQNSFIVRNNLMTLKEYENKSDWENITDVDVKKIRDGVTPILPQGESDEFAKRFDALMYSLMMNKLVQKNYSSQIKTLFNLGEALAQMGRLPQVKEKAAYINAMCEPDQVVEMELPELETIRNEVRSLISLIPKDKVTPIYSDIIDVQTKEEDGENIKPASGGFEPYKMRVAKYLNDHIENMVIYKIRHNMKLTGKDISDLEYIMFEELGTKDEFEQEYRNKSLVEAVRNIVGMDEETINNIFWFKYVNDNELNSKQMHFLKTLINYVIKNGSIDKNLLNEMPFTYYGNIVDIFAGKQDMLRNIVKDIDELNANAKAA